MKHKYVFVCGLHRSGTSSLTKLIGSSSFEVSIHKNSGKPENEGHHIQNVYPNGLTYGGPGNFAMHNVYHFTENNALATQENNEKIIKQWEQFWDLTKPILVEKSPPNIIHTRYLQQMVDDSYFVCIMRHPYIVALATRKWNPQLVEEHIVHWLRAHEILFNDLEQIKKYKIVKYETLDAKKFEKEMSTFLNTRLSFDASVIENFLTSNFKYLKDNPIALKLRNRFENQINKYGYSFSPPYWT